MTYSKTTSSASRSKKCSPSASPATPCSMIRKNGSRAWKSASFPTAVIGPPRAPPQEKSRSQVHTARSPSVGDAHDQENQETQPQEAPEPVAALDKLLVCPNRQC